MSIAPEPILRAGNETISWACIFLRNQTLQDGASLRMINELMEAIHEVPNMLANWGGHTVQDVRHHLSCFQAPRWHSAPNLVTFFNQRLVKYGGDEGAVN
jgi:hypothetical protein